VQSGVVAPGGEATELSIEAKAANFLRVGRGEAAPPAYAAEGAEDLHFVADIVRPVSSFPAHILRAERADGILPW
jgi:hypothetical protein